MSTWFWGPGARGCVVCPMDFSPGHGHVFQPPFVDILVKQISSRDGSYWYTNPGQGTSMLAPFPIFHFIQRVTPSQRSNRLSIPILPQQGSTHTHIRQRHPGRPPSLVGTCTSAMYRHTKTRGRLRQACHITLPRIPPNPTAGGNKTGRGWFFRGRCISPLARISGQVPFRSKARDMEAGD